MNLALSPAGRPYLETDPEGVAEAVPVPPAAAARIAQAFEQGGAQGLLQLGAVELGPVLPPSLAFGREFAHRFMVQLTSVSTLADDWATVTVSAPEAELTEMAAAAPPMTGAEYLNADVLAAWWADLHTAAREDIAASGGDVAAWLHGKHPSWNLVGRVCLHLAENKSDERAPFAFLATSVSRLSRDARAQHVPLGRALQGYSASQDRAGMLKLLLPMHKAAEQSPWLKALVDSGQVFHPQAWTPPQAYEFSATCRCLRPPG